MDMDIRDIAIRAAKTALQAAIAVLLAGLAGGIDISLIQSAGVAALAAALSVANNTLLAMLREDTDTPADDAAA